MQHLVNQYLAQLNVEPELSGLALVQALKSRHIATFPFSSANVLLKSGVSTEPADLFQRVVSDRMGGYCFEHNKIMYLALKSFGFKVRPIMARVLLDGNEENGRLHRVTLLELDQQQYLVDVGFGVMNPRFVVPLTARSYDTDSGLYRLEILCNGHYRLTHKPHNKDWLTLYRFDLSEATEKDCEIGHFYSSQYSDATFVNNLVVSRVTDHQRVLVRNHQFIRFDDNAGSEHLEPIQDHNHLHKLLTEACLLNISVSDSEKLFTFVSNKAY